MLMKTIMISDETYEKLSSIKGKKSFTILLSELVESLKQKKSYDIMKFAGTMSKSEANEVEKSQRR
ncbi:MAG: antitoxin VapB family protein [Candidatus Micrarchaeota archaeon]|nr:antitoxin VapB family protein [Candidatus Micrarchaeota archaeon]MDE1834496.1 antitoxin VapB family protein [Candidatus Micrarchaeota archaeon]MDE1859952.1 antitoxin VapB family protein [Candidatus Micrarchaeota archaeon]